MPRGLSIQVSDDVRSLLAAAPAGTFSLPLTVKRSFTPVVELKSLVDSVLVTVLASGRDMTFLARNMVSNKHQIQICLQKKLASPEDEEEIDGLTSVLEDEIPDYLMGDANGVSRRLLNANGTSSSNAVLTEISIDLLYSQQQMRDLQTFLGVIKATYESNRVYR